MQSESYILMWHYAGLRVFVSRSLPRGYVFSQIKDEAAFMSKQHMERLIPFIGLPGHIKKKTRRPPNCRISPKGKILKN